MPVLDCLVPEKDWIHEVQRDGFLRMPAEQPASKPLANAGAWEPAVKKVISFQHLGDDWDGLGAKALTRELLESAIGLAYVLLEKGVDPPQGVVPGLEGSVNFEWQEPDGTIAEIEIDRPFHAEVMLIEPGKSPRFWTLPTE